MEQKLVAVVDSELCRGCHVCVRSCPLRIIAIKDRLAVLTGTCVGCGKCIGYCPFKARRLVVDGAASGGAAANGAAEQPSN